MKKIMLPVFILALAGCGKKEWSKESLVNDCLGDFKKGTNRKNYLIRPGFHTSVIV